jgi:hypothetical protein
MINRLGGPAWYVGPSPDQPFVIGSQRRIRWQSIKRAACTHGVVARHAGTNLGLDRHAAGLLMTQNPMPAGRMARWLVTGCAFRDATERDAIQATNRGELFGKIRP